MITPLPLRLLYKDMLVETGWIACRELVEGSKVRGETGWCSVSIQEVDDLRMQALP